MVSIAVSKLCMTKLIFVVPVMKVNGSYYHDVLLSADAASVKHVAGNTFAFQQDNAASYRAKDTIKLLQQEMPDFTGPDFLATKQPRPESSGL